MKWLHAAMYSLQGFDDAAFEHSHNDTCDDGLLLWADEVEEDILIVIETQQQYRHRWPHTATWTHQAHYLAVCWLF